MNNVYPFLPRLTVNAQFIHDFLIETPPCFALGLVEERKEISGFLALRPNHSIPPETANLGFRFGHGLLGSTDDEVILFAFEFYGFETYTALVNPNNPVVQSVLTTLVEKEDYFFFALNSNQSATAFRAPLEQTDLVGLKTNLPRILNSTTTDLQYQHSLIAFRKNPDPVSQVLQWVCRDNIEYLDLTQHRFELNPSSKKT